MPSLTMNVADPPRPHRHVAAMGTVMPVVAQDEGMHVAPFTNVRWLAHESVNARDFTLFFIVN